MPCMFLPGVFMSDTEIKTLSTQVLKDDLYKEINSLISENILNNSFPYTKTTPLPQDMNVVNGRHLGDINKIQLELKASLISAKSLKWIYGADAALLNLELKENEKPLVALANISKDSHLKTDAQTFYLLDQFSENSLQKAVKIVRDEKTTKQKKIIAQEMIKNITEYDSGLNEKEIRENKRKNISNNLSKNGNVLANVREAFSNATEEYSPEEKTLFSLLNNYFVQQETGITIQKFSDEQKSKALETVKTLSIEDSPKLTRLFTESFLYSERMTHYNFEINRVFTKDDLNKSLPVRSPSASAFEHKRTHELEAQKNMERLLERDIEIKPRHISHDRRR